MFTVSIIYIFWMFGNIHVNTVGGAGCGGRSAGHVDPVDMKLGLRVGHPGLGLGPVEDQQVGGGGHAGHGGRDSDGSGGGGTTPLPQLGPGGGALLLTLKAIFGLFIAECGHARVLRAQR